MTKAAAETSTKPATSARNRARPFGSVVPPLGAVPPCADEDSHDRASGYHAMSQNDDHSELTLNITEDHTGEYPVLQESDALAASAPTGLNGTSPAPQRQTEPPVKAAFWLAHLEAEVTRMHAKWQSIETEFKSREARISRLHEEIKARDTTIANLTVEVQREAASLKVADERLTSKDEEIASLLEDRRARDERIAALATELADSEVAHKATREQVVRAEAEAARLNDAVQREQAAAARVVERDQQLLAEHNLLQVKVQDLETYIDGRRDRWSELNTKLKDYENTLIERGQNDQRARRGARST